MDPSINILPTFSFQQTRESHDVRAPALETVDEEEWQTYQGPVQTSLNRDNEPALAVVQQALDTLDKNNLTKSQHHAVIKDLLYAAQKMLVHEGCTTSHPFTFHQRIFHLNALHLACLSTALAGEVLRPTPVGIWQALSVLDEIRTVMPDAFTKGISNINDAQSSFHTSELPLTPVEQNMANEVIKSVSPSLREDSKNIEAVLIGRKTFLKVMNRAVDQPGFPAVLRRFHQAARHCPGMRLALKTQPSLAFALLFPGRHIGPATVPANYHEQLMNKFAPADLIRLADECPIGQSEPAPLSKILLVIFESMRGFGARNAIQVPSCFDIHCPVHSLARVNDHRAAVHANVVSNTGPGLLIAAMQPVTLRRNAPIRPSDLSFEEHVNVGKFLSMVASQDRPVIVDLRSASELNNGRGIEYCPQQVGETHQFNDVSITTTHMEERGPNLQRLTVQVAVGQNPPVELEVAQYRAWPDHKVVEPGTLRMLGQLVAQGQRAGASVVTHCGAGVGRTGTVIAYARLYQRLIVESEAQALFTEPEMSEPKRQTLIKRIVEEVVNGRVHRGPMFVENEAQFQLLGETILEDVQNWKNDNSSSASGSNSDSASNSEFTHLSPHPPEFEPAFELPAASDLTFTSEVPAVPEIVPEPEITPAAPEITPAPEAVRSKPTSSSEPYSWVEETALQVPNMNQRSSSVTLHANRVQLIPNHTFTIAQEPKTAQDKWQHLHNMFNQGCDVLEFVSDSNRLAQGCSSPKTKGLSFLNPVALDAFKNPAKYGGKPDLHIGNFRINDVRQTMTSNIKNGCAVHVYQIDVTDKETGIKKSICHAQLFSEFKSNHWTKDRLKAMLKLVDQCKLNFRGLWLGSAAGIGRPSAWLMARHISHAVHNKQMNEGNYREMIDAWINTGRQQRSRNFVHTTAQKEELLLLAQDLIKQQAGRKIPEHSPRRGALSKKPKIFSHPLYSFQDLLNWIKKHLKPAKT